MWDIPAPTTISHSAGRTIAEARRPYWRRNLNSSRQTIARIALRAWAGQATVTLPIHGGAAAIGAAPSTMLLKPAARVSETTDGLWLIYPQRVEVVELVQEAFDGGKLHHGIGRSQKDGLP